MKKILLVEEPPITSYPIIANILSIIWPHKKKVMPWLCDHMIQLIIRPDYIPTKADFYEHADLDNFICILYGCPHLEWMRNNCYTAEYEKFTDYIEFQINNGYFVEPNLDNYYFEFSLCYKSYHLIHPTLIYGYDNDRKIVYVSDFYNHGRYIRKEISYDEINRSMKNDYIMNLYKYQEAEYLVNHKLMNMYLRDYLNAKDSSMRFEQSYQEYNHNVIFGIDVYDYIIDKMCNKDELDIRPFHVLYDHKELMKLRLMFLNDYPEYSCKLEGLLELNEEARRDALHLRNLVLKYNISHDRRLLESIKSRCFELKMKDINLISEILLVTV